MKSGYCFLIFSIVLLGCRSFKEISKGEGIVGEVRWVEGNLMPAVGDPTYAARARGKTVQREVYFFEAVKREETVSGGGPFYKSVNSKLVHRLRTEKNGSFKVQLPPGMYSVFVLEEGLGFFTNIMDGNDYLNPVTVEADQTTEIQILLNYKAYY